jgi:hypothetical protein
MNGTAPSATPMKFGFLSTLNKKNNGRFAGTLARQRLEAMVVQKEQSMLALKVAQNGLIQPNPISGSWK